MLQMTGGWLVRFVVSFVSILCSVCCMLVPGVLFKSSVLSSFVCAWFGLTWCHGCTDSSVIFVQLSSNEYVVLVSISNKGISFMALISSVRNLAGPCEMIAFPIRIVRPFIVCRLAYFM